MGMGRVAIVVVGVLVCFGCSKKEEEDGGWASVIGKKIGKQVANQMKVEADWDEAPGPALDCSAMDWSPLRASTGGV